MKRTELALYFTNGQVAYFIDVRNFEENEDEIRFEYFGQASRRNRLAIFTKGTYSGISITVDSDKDLAEENEFFYDGNGKEVSD